MSARAANGSAIASARSAEATASGPTSGADVPSISSLASGVAKTKTATAATSEEITTGTIVARRMAGILRSARSTRNRAMK